MNPVAEEIMSYYGISDSDNLEHYGMPKRSGRYPWGSGEDPYQHGSRDFLGRYDELKKKGLSEKEIAKEMGIVNEKGEPSTGKLRAQLGYASNERRLYQIETAKRLRDKEGLGPTAIGKEMGLPESTVRSLLNPKVEERAREAKATVDFLRDQVNEKGMIDVGAGVNNELRISKERLNQALYVLEQEGYPVYKGGIPQATNPGKQINQRVLCVPGTKHREIYEFDRVQTINDYISRDDGQSFEKKFTYPASMDSKRLKIRYAEDGGIDKDGIVEIRRGVEDLSLGESHYAQVRILVDKTHYIKGMAVYSDNLPDGVDVMFNTNKKAGTPMTKVLKEIKNDPDNPFGSLIKDADQGGQYWYTDSKTGKRKLGLINKRADEGDWEEWKDALPSQFLGKQSMQMIKKQLNLAKADKLAEYDSICELNNPTIKKHLLEEFANNCDAAAVHLKAAALPGQKYHVIIPVNTLKDTEVYAPQYSNGQKLALVRYPHGGTFEIPILTVNNKHKAAKDLIGSSSIDAIGITKKIADQLSGADFDGDTVMCIPTHDSSGKVKVTSTKRTNSAFAELDDFDPKLAYPETPGMKYMGKKLTQTQMGVISNLITDMTLQGAAPEELVRAVKHSMVVIDAEKHKLNYKQSEIDNNITALKKKYQVKEDGGYGGAATILSRAKGETQVDKRQGSPHINIKGTKDYDPTRPEGALVYKKADPANLYKPVSTKNNKTGIVTLTTDTGAKVKYNPDDPASREKYHPIKNIDADGNVKYTNKGGDITYAVTTKKQKSTKMAETDDAYSLVSVKKNPKEMAYAEYANTMKSLANQARKEMVSTGKLKYSATAKNTYRAEYDSLMSKLNEAELNAVKERAAQRKTQVDIAAKKAANPDATTSDIKKASQQSLSANRTSVGSVSRRDRNIDITDREWEAIQAGAISENQLKKILNNTDADKLRERATPRRTSSLSKAQINRAKALSASNYSIGEIAKKLGVSPSTVSNYLKGVS